MDHGAYEIAAIVVAYYPDLGKIKRLIDIIQSQVDHVVIMDNGSQPDFHAFLSQYQDITYLSLNKNLGIGAALNAGLNRAAAVGCSHFITFDQDSFPDPNMVDRLLTAMERLRTDGYNVAAVGPTFIDQRQDPPMRYPFYRQSGLHVKRIYCSEAGGMIEVDSLITSGCLFPVGVFSKIKQFDEGYFVDYVDTDWCFHARSLGFRLYGICDATMSHELGSGESKSFASIRLIEYSPLRRYYYFRNTVQFIRRSYVSWFWKVKLSFGLLVRILFLPVTPGAKKWQQLAMMVKGINHGLAGISGPAIDTVIGE